MRAGFGFLCLLLSVTVLGCGSQLAQQKRELARFGLAYLTYVDAHKSGPARLEDLQDSAPAFPILWEEIKRGDVIVVWLGTLPPDGAHANCLLAYQKATAESGGLVLMGDGLVKWTTAEEFKSIPKLPVKVPEEK